MTKVVINTRVGGFGLSEGAQAQFYRLTGQQFDYVTPRDHPALVMVVEHLGPLANDKYSVLKIVDVPNDVRWHVICHDNGTESVHEDHRIWV